MYYSVLGMMCTFCMYVCHSGVDKAVYCICTCKFSASTLKAENHMTYFDYFVLVFGQNG